MNNSTAPGVWRRLALYYAVSLATIFSLRDYLPNLARDDLMEGDLNQHVWWTHRFADPLLFPGDFIADFFSRTALAPPGYQGLYRVLVPYFDPQWIAEALPFGLMAVVTALSFLIGRRAAGGHWLGGVVGVSYATLGHILRSHGQAALPRAFGMPILLLGTWALMSGRRGWAGVALVLGALFYPPAVLNLGLVTVLVAGHQVYVRGRIEGADVALAMLGLSAVAILALSYLTPLAADLGPQVGKQQAFAMAEFHPGGRSRFFETDPVSHYLTSPRSGLGASATALAAFGLLVGLVAIRVPGLIPRIAWVHLGVALGLFVLAHATLFKLHLPNRYSDPILTLFMLIFASAALPRLVYALDHRYRCGQTLPAFWRRPAVMALLVTALLTGLALEAADKVGRELQRPVNTALEHAYAVLARFPRDALVAAHPLDANDIPLRTRHSVLASMEVSLPYYLGYYRRVAERIEASLAASLARDWSQADDLYHRYGVDVFLVNRRRFRDPGYRYFAPFDKNHDSRYAGHASKSFVLFKPPAHRVLFREGGISIVRLGPPREIINVRDQRR